LHRLGGKEYIQYHNRLPVGNVSHAGAKRERANRKELLLANTSLTWSRLREIIGSLAEAGLLSVEEDGRWVNYKLRTKGHELIRKYNGVVERIETAHAVIEVRRH
jgi:predicted transcriptional regulator